jgi:plasmid maintenance system antidote protein VapI
MTSFQLSVPANRKAASRFIDRVHRKLQKAFASKPHITQTQIAASLGVHRSVINRQLRGHQDMTVGRIGELAWALGLEAELVLLEPPADQGNAKVISINKIEMRTVKPSSGTPQVIAKSLDTKVFA